MSSETKISSVNIFHTLKKGKKIMKEKFSEDYEDFKKRRLQFNMKTTKRQTY